MNDWLNEVPDSRVQDQTIYETRFLGWYGISLFLFPLGSRRQLDFEFDPDDTYVLNNLNRLAHTDHQTRPVNGTLEHFLDHSQPSGFAHLGHRMLQRLIRMKYLDRARLQGCFLMPVDATGLYSFSERHCPHCLEQCHEHYTVFSHSVLEAKILGPEDMVFSVASEFIENADVPTTACSAEAFKQDCELNAFSRLAPQVKDFFPQLRLCIGGDSLYACGRTLQICKDYHWSYLLTFKEKHMPAVWQDFQALLPLCPHNRLGRTFPRGKHTVEQAFRWVHDISYTDSEGRSWTFTVLSCQETVNGQTTTFVWITDLMVNEQTVTDVAQGGRGRWTIENQGFNRQKNSSFNLEHLYSHDPDNLKAYYYLLQIAHMILLLVENGKYLRRLAEQRGQTPRQWLGSLKNIARRLLDSLRYCPWPADADDLSVSDAAFEPGLDTS
jgi:hypothetical protein